MENVTSEIRKQATAYALEMSVPKGELDHRFNGYWDEVKDVLHPDLIKAAKKGGFREVRRDRVIKAAGGMSAFYKPVLAEVVQEHLDKQERQALTFNDVEVKEGFEQYNIRALVYLEPEVTWKGTPPGVGDEPLTVKIPKEPEGMAERMVQQEIASAQERSTILVPVPEGSGAQPEQVVVIDCETIMDGELWPPGCFTNNKWLLRTELFHIPEMMQALIGAKTGETRKTQGILNERFTEDVRGKSVDITMKVVQIFNREVPAVDDDLAITFGYENIEAYKTALMGQAQKKLAENKDQLVFSSVLGQVLNTEKVEIEPVPFVWITQKAREIYGQARTMVRTEEELISQFERLRLLNGTPVTDKATLLTFLAEQVGRQLIQDLVIRSWGKMKGVEGNRSLESLSEYVSAVKKVLISSAKLEEYTVSDFSAQAATNG